MTDYHNSIYSGAQIDEAVGRALSGRAGINRNLLDNWYFGNPVNQRGQTEYTGAVYTIDRWRGEGEYSIVTVSDGCVSLVGSGGAVYLRQYIDDLTSFFGKKATISVLFADGTLTTATGIIPSAVGSSSQTASTTQPHNGCTFSITLSSGGKLYAQFRVTSGYSAMVFAAKMELGSTQTLAHQDENGNWVLNEIPNYAEELAKCQRYFYAFDFTDWPGVGAYWGRGISSTEIELYNLTFPVTMRINPALNNLKVYEDGSGNTYDVVPSSFLLKKEGLRRIDISSGMTAIEGRTYVVVKAWISADL